MCMQLLDQFDSEGNADTVITSDGKNSAGADKVENDGGKGGFRTKDEEILLRLTAYASCLISGAR
jgi:hypothetical protein